VLLVAIALDSTHRSLWPDSDSKQSCFLPYGAVFCVERVFDIQSSLVSSSRFEGLLRGGGEARQRSGRFGGPSGPGRPSRCLTCSGSHTRHHAIIDNLLYQFTLVLAYHSAELIKLRDTGANAHLDLYFGLNFKFESSNEDEWILSLDLVKKTQSPCIALFTHLNASFLLS